MRSIADASPPLAAAAAAPSLARTPRRQRLVALAIAGTLGLTGVVGTNAAGATPLDWLTGAACDAGGAGVDAVDAGGGGRVALGGTVGLSAVFGKGEPNETLIENSAYETGYFASYNPNGRLAWAVEAAYLGVYNISVAIGAGGDVFGSGTTWDNVCFHSAPATQICVQSLNDFDGESFIPFFVRFDKHGYARWLRTIDDREGGYADGESTIAADRHGRAIVAGIYAGPITFGWGEANATRLTGEGLYVAQYRPDGSLGWAHRALTGPLWSAPIDVAADAAGSGVVAGSFSGQVVFAPGLPQRVTLVAAGQKDVFVAKYDWAGRLLWAIRQGSASDDTVLGVATDADRRIFLLASDGQRVTLSRFGPAGGRHFTRTLSGIAAGSAIAVGADGTLAISGRFRDGATFGAGQPNAATLRAASGDADAFVARYGPGGRFLSVEPIVAAGESESGPKVAIDDRSRLIVAGTGVRPIRLGDGADARVWRLGDLYLGRFAAAAAAADAAADPWAAE